MTQYLGAHSFGLVWSMDAASAVRELSERGFKHIQLLATVPHLDPWSSDTGSLKALKRSIAATGCEIVAVDLPSSETNLASANPEVVDFSVEAYVGVIRTSAEIGARWATVNAGRKHALLPPPDNRLLHAYGGAIERLSRVAEISGVRLLLENIPGTILSGARAIRDFAAELPQVDILYDVANAASIGEDPSEGIRVLGGELALIHLSDARDGSWRHDPIGTGNIDFTQIRHAVAETGYSGGVIIEVLSPSTLDDLVTSRDRLGALGWM